MNHEIVRRSGEYQCLVCQWGWQSRPQSECPGVPRYSWWTKPKHLLSKTQMNLAGFKLREGQKARGMVQSANGKEWWWLFDIREADSKKPGRSPEHGLAILKEKLARKEQREKQRTLWGEIDWKTSQLLHNLNALSTWVTPTHPNPPHGNLEYWLKVREGAIHRLISFIRSDIAKSKKVFHELYPPAKPEPGDMVLGGKSPRPEPGDMVLGGTNAPIR